MSSAAPDGGDGPDPGLKDLIHKTVAFPFDGHTLQLGLSQSLFSSFAVDSGSRLLLTSLTRQLAAQRDEQQRLHSILDLGCGTGVLGLALAKRYATHLTARDRDALALAVTAHNAAANGISCSTRGGLDTTNLDGSRDRGRYQLVVSNLPAKAGAPVLARMLAAATEVTAPGGRVAVVVVAPLAEQIRRQFAGVAELIHETRGNRHTVFHARPASSSRLPTSHDSPAAALAPYERHQGEVTLAGLTYSLTTVYGLPDFDTPSHLAQLTVALMLRTGLQQPPASAPPSLLAWNPGQGHLPVWLARAYGAAPAAPGNGPRFTLVSRDALQLLATRANLAQSGIAPQAVALHHRVTLRAAPAQYDLALLHPDTDLTAAGRGALLATLAPLLTPCGRLVVGGGAPAMAPVLARRKPFTLVREIRRRALRAAILRAPGRQPEPNLAD